MSPRRLTTSKDEMYEEETYCSGRPVLVPDVPVPVALSIGAEVIGISLVPAG